MHHAYLYEGSPVLFSALAEDARARFGFNKRPPTGGNPDVYAECFEKFGIGDARTLERRAVLRSTSGRALFVISVSSITSEAQQALLKLLEEPQKGSMFVFLLPHGAAIPTLRSRMMEYPAELTKDGPLLYKGPSFVGTAKKFLAASYKARSAEIAALLKDEPARPDDSGHSGGEGTRERTREFLGALETELHRKIGAKKEIRSGLEDIAKVRGYLGDKAPALKMLLEHLAATLPQI